MVQLIKKGGLRERANRSRSYQGSENTETTLKPNTYPQSNKKEELSPPSNEQSQYLLDTDSNSDLSSNSPK
ncbi:MAG: hypothetical protein H9855_08735 [Candidatus Acinetobacter avistercoris]|uniref:hypothetical protein n=1 Tax=Acinetobacter sp. KS-LM10 TaxID=3120518 RepID=UPI001F8A9AA7|nr:hypothetical protein [Candidatus Acinetobacter avistercoris]